VLAQLAHESVAELPDLVIGFALGIEICSSLSTTNVHCGWLSATNDHVKWRGSGVLTASQSILEDLFETQKLQD